MSGNPLLCFMCDGDQSLKVIETERGAVAPCARLILEWAGKGRCEERSVFADVDRLDRAYPMIESVGKGVGEEKAQHAAQRKQLILSGDPPGTRTQGPRLKSSNRSFSVSARYCVWFPQNLYFRSLRAILLVPVFLLGLLFPLLSDTKLTQSKSLQGICPQRG